MGVGRAELYLLKLAVRQSARYLDGPMPREFVREEVDARCLDRFERVARLFVAAGALRSDDVEPFRSRLAETIESGHGVPLVVEEDLMVGARRLLERRLDEVARAIASGRPATQVDEVRDRFRRTHAAVDKCRGLSRDELRVWLGRLCEIDPDGTQSLELVRVGACRLTDLLCVVPGSVSDDCSVRIVTAELYADAVVLRWQSRGAPQMAPSERQPDVSLTDDAGTMYVHVSTGRRGHYARAYSAGKSLFSTPAPPSARTLTADFGEQRLAIAFPSVRGGS